MHKGESPVCYSSLNLEDSTNIITFGIDCISTFEIGQHCYTGKDIDPKKDGILLRMCYFLVIKLGVDHKSTCLYRVSAFTCACVASIHAHTKDSEA